MNKRRGLAVLVCAFVCFWLLAPQKATGQIAQITMVSKGSLDMTGQLEGIILSELASGLSNTRCLRWKNPINVYPLENDTIIIECEDKSGTHRFLFVGSKERFTIDSYPIFGGAELFMRVVSVVESAA